MKSSAHKKLVSLITLLSTGKILLAILGVLLVAGWLILRFMSGAYQADSHALVVIRRDKQMRPVEAISQGQLTPTLNDPDYRLVSDMAMLSAIVYSGKNAPNHLPDYTDKEDFEVYKLERSILKNRGWHRFEVPTDVMQGLQPAAETRKLDGFTFDVWIKDPPGHAPLAVFVFRGTDELADWKANLRPPMVSPGRWDQYEQAKAVTAKMINRLEQKYGGKQRMFATGHSLGGGLAQCARNNFRRIEKVFAFNSSPITGYLNASRQDKLANSKQRPIYLIYESNEILAAARFIPLFVNTYTGRKNVIAVRYNFNTKRRGQHSMQPLVLGLLGK